MLQLFPALSAHSFSSILLTQLSLFKTHNKNTSYSEENFSRRLICLHLTLFWPPHPHAALFYFSCKMHTTLVYKELLSFKHCPAPLPVCLLALTIHQSLFLSGQLLLTILFSSFNSVRSMRPPASVSHTFDKCFFYQPAPVFLTASSSSAYISIYSK